MEQHISDIPELAAREIALRPDLFGQEREFRKFCLRLTKRLGDNSQTDRQQVIEQAREDVEAIASGPTDKPRLALKFACSVVLDVVAQGWELLPGQKCINIRSPKFQGETHEEIKRRIRAGHLLERDAQLRQASVAEFIRSMEHRGLGPTGWVSIYSLMRDGGDLAPKLAQAAAEPSEDKRANLLRTAVSPYLQLVEP